MSIPSKKIEARYLVLCAKLRHYSEKAAPGVILIAGIVHEMLQVLIAGLWLGFGLVIGLDCVANGLNKLTPFTKAVCQLTPYVNMKLAQPEVIMVAGVVYLLFLIRWMVKFRSFLEAYAIFTVFLLLLALAAEPLPIGVS